MTGVSGAGGADGADGTYGSAALRGVDSAGGVRRTEHLFQPDLAASLNEDYDWVAQGPVPQFVARLRHMRGAQREAMAMRALHAFALHRPVLELVQLAHEFAPRDAVMLMATAALSRPVSEAAQLALLQYRTESDPARAPVTASIVHDVACQRTAFDVAVFVRVLKGEGEREGQELAEHTVRLFASPGSGRTNLDKALLHIALVDEGCRDEAGQLLDLTLRAIAGSPPDAVAPGAESEESAESEGIADLADAFQHLSPGGRVLEQWVEKRLQTDEPMMLEETRQFVATLIARSGADQDALAAYIGGTAHPRHVAKVCALLTRGKDESPAKRDLVRHHALGREDVEKLAQLVSYWHKEPDLTRTTRQLLADIVTATRVPDGAPRSLSELNRMADWLGRSHYYAPGCSRALRSLAAERVEGCDGGQLAALLNRVERRRRSQVAHKAGRRLAMAVMGTGGDRDQVWFVGCLLALHDAKHTVAVRAACRELTDPSHERRVDAALVADVAGRLYGVGLTKVAWDLLERFLENEQLVTAADVVEVMRRGPRLPVPDTRLLLRATVGRWSDMGHRDSAVAQLRADGRDDAADWVVKSLR